MYKYTTHVKNHQNIEYKPLSSIVISRVQENDLDELETTVEPTWPKLVEPLEKGIVNHLNAVKDSPELRYAIEEVQVWVIFSAHK